MENHSEVARLVADIQRSYEAAQRALYAPSITAPHDFIAKRMEHIQNAHATLQTIIGEQEATRLLVQVLDGTGENSES